LKKLIPVALPPGRARLATKAHRYRILADGEHDRDRRCRSFGRKRGNIGERGDHGHATANKIGHEPRQAIVLALQPVVLHHYVLAFDVADFV
jgi:hypothetical protein